MSAEHPHGHPAASALPEVGHLPPHWEPTPIIPSLPFGVAFLAILVAGGGVLLVVSAVLAFLHLLAGAYLPAGILIFAPVDEIGAGVLLVLGAVLIAVARALWDLELWALYLSVVALFAGLAYLFFTASITILFVVLLVVFVYLLAVRHHFY